VVCFADTSNNTPYNTNCSACEEEIETSKVQGGSEDIAERL